MNEDVKFKIGDVVVMKNSESHSEYDGMFGLVVGEYALRKAYSKRADKKTEELDYVVALPDLADDENIRYFNATPSQMDGPYIKGKNETWFLREALDDGLFITEHDTPRINTNIDVCGSEKIDQYGDIAGDFMKHVVGIEIERCFISDESSLPDFPCATLQEYCDKTMDRFGVDISDMVNATFAEIFERINEQTKR